MIEFNNLHPLSRLLTDEIQNLKKQLTAFDFFQTSENGSLEAVEAQIATELSLKKAMICPSGTDALEFGLLLLDLQPGDEVIIPSFTFSSTANAIVNRGGVPVFVDCDLDTLNLDLTQVESAIRKQTKGVIPIHYGGVVPDMDRLRSLCNEKGLWILEDSAHALGAKYKDQYAGSLGQLAAFSCHATKNLPLGEGGFLAINNPDLIDRAQQIRDKGTNRKQYIDGQVDKYRWTTVGSSYAISEISARTLDLLIRKQKVISQDRIRAWDYYFNHLSSAAIDGLRLAKVPKDSLTNGHIFWALLDKQFNRDEVIAKFRKRGIALASHYVPLHSAPMGRRYTNACIGGFRNTELVAAQQIRLPMYYGITKSDQDRVISCLVDLLGKKVDHL